MVCLGSTVKVLNLSGNPLLEVHSAVVSSEITGKVLNLSSYPLLEVLSGLFREYCLGLEPEW